MLIAIGNAILSFLTKEIKVHVYIVLLLLVMIVSNTCIAVHYAKQKIREQVLLEAEQTAYNNLSRKAEEIRSYLDEDVHLSDHDIDVIINDILSQP